jgi:hypothetical protein
VPQVLRDARQRAISAKRPPSKRPASNHLQGDADQAREGTSRVGASLLKSDLMLAAYKTPCNLHGRGCFVLRFAHATEVAGEAGAFDPQALTYVFAFLIILPCVND